MTDHHCRAALAVGLALIVIAPGAAGAASAPHRFDRLVVAIGADPVGTAPALHFHAPGKLVVQHVAEGLVAHRDDMNIVPMLAERVNVSADRLTYTFELRPDVRFHNGARLEADDVVWVWQNYYLDPETGWDCRVYYDGSGSIEERTNGAHVLSVEAQGTRRVVFTLAEPSNLFLARMADVSCAPVIVHRDSIARDGSWKELIGTGPYRMLEWRKGDLIRLGRFEDYRPRAEPRDGYAGAKIAYAEEIELRIMPDRLTALAALESGDIDVLLDVQEAERSLLENRPGIDLHTTGTINFWNLLIQTQDPLLADVRMRRAIAHAIDLDYLVAVLTAGRQGPNPSVISRNSHFHSAVHDRGHRFDTGLARRLLKEAGYQGEALEIQANRDTYPEMHGIGVLVRSMLRAVGINAVLKVIPWQEQLETHYRNGTFQLQAFGQGGRNHPALVYGKFIGPKADKARFQWDDPQAYALLERVQSAPDEAAQQAIFDELHVRMLEQVPTLALFNFEYHDATRQVVHGFHTTPFMRTTLWGVWKE